MPETRDQDQVEEMAEMAESSRDSGDSFLPVELEEDQEDISEIDDGLEMDERQAEEIRQIFGTTLPQYLQPVEEMIEQILSSEEMDVETFQALQGTLSSLRMAAGRMGFEEIGQGLEQLGDRIAELSQRTDDFNPRELRESIIGELLDIKDLAHQMGGDEAVQQTKVPSETIFKALAGKRGLGKSVLQKLSAAGLVMVEQLRVAQPNEIAAVTGLDLEVVHDILDHISADRSQEPAEARVLDLPLDADPLRAMLHNKLRDQVEAEAALQETKAQIQKLRSSINNKRTKLRTLDRRRNEVNEALTHISGHLVDRALSLNKARLTKEELVHRYTALAESLRGLEAKLERLQQISARITQEDASLDQQLEQVLERTGRALRMAATGKRTENAQVKKLTSQGGSKR